MIPDQVRANLNAFLPTIRKNKLKGMVCPAGGLTTSLFSEGILSDEEISGFLDNDETKHGTEFAGLPVKPLYTIAENPPDFVILASMTFRKQLSAQLLPLSRRHGFKLHDICDLPTSLSPVRFDSCLSPVPAVVLQNLKNRLPSLIANRSKVVLYPDNSVTRSLWLRGVFANVDVQAIVDQLDDVDSDVVTLNVCEGMNFQEVRSECAETVGKKLLANRMAEWPVRKFQIWVPNQNLCDSLCAISAAREFARRHPDVEVQFPHMPEVLNAYGDHLVRPGYAGYVVPAQPQHFLFERSGSIAGNYQGSYHLGVGLDFKIPPRPELPTLLPPKGLLPQSYIALHAGVEAKQLESIFHTMALPVVSIGNGRTPLEILRLIQHAAVVLTSRNLASHIAAAYDVPSVVWTPGDGLDWHLDYTGWNHRRIPQAAPGFVERVEESIESLTYENTRSYVQ